jgi:hypothetical protein
MPFRASQAAASSAQPNFARYRDIPDTDLYICRRVFDLRSEPGMFEYLKCATFGASNNPMECPMPQSNDWHMHSMRPARVNH